ncbi:MAG: hypothetical protein Q8L68_03155, partial [Methylococcales bacterium]|nr:hypothetical protein [Methylococcales bacterium]
RDSDHTGFIINSPDNPSLALNPRGDVIIPTIKSDKDYVYDGSLNIETQTSRLSKILYSVELNTGKIIQEAGQFAQIITAKIQVGLVEAQNIIVSNTIVAKNIVAKNVRSYELGVRRIFVEEKIVSPIVETTSLTSRTAQINQVTTNEIKPADTDLAIDLQPNSAGVLARLIIKGLEGKTVTTIDSAGNASFSGQIIADSLTINNDATIAGTLTADKIEAENISDLTKTVFDQKQSLTDQSSSINDIQALLAEIKSQPLPDPTNQTNISKTTNFDTDVINHVSINDLTVTDTSNLYNVSVSNSLLVGTTLLDQNSIISLASELKLSALSTINLFDGAVIIAKDGKITTRGEIIAVGGIRTNEIKALTDDGQVSINNLTVNNLTIDKISTNSAVIAAADNFEKNGIFAPAIEAATASAGLGILPANQSEIIIYNDRVSADSLIYLTPTSDAPTNG